MKAQRSKWSSITKDSRTMIYKAEPDKVLRFVQDNFNLLRELYRLQLRDSIVSQDAFQALTTYQGEVIKKRLFDYKLLTERNGDYRLTEAVRQFLGFLLNEFKPLLPAQLRRYQISLGDLFGLLQTTPASQEDLLLERQEHLYDEILSFLDNVAGNTSQLLRKTQRLKSNKRQLSYPERVHQARHLIEHYIQPLNQILNHQNENSITRLLWRMGERMILEKIATHSPTIQERYEQLDDLLRSANEHLLRQSRIITRELLPLLERLQRESEVLNGWLFFLESPLLRPVPDFTKPSRYPTFSDQTESEVRFFLEQFANRQEGILISVAGAATENSLPRFFDSRTYARRLQAALPVANYFQWCIDTLQQYESQLDAQHFIQLASLVFDETANYTLLFSESRVRLQLAGITYLAPVIEVKPVQS